jgi:hypothetical protein
LKSAPPIEAATMDDPSRAKLLIRTLVNIVLARRAMPLTPKSGNSGGPIFSRMLSKRMR